MFAIGHLVLFPGLSVCFGTQEFRRARCQENYIENMHEFSNEIEWKNSCLSLFCLNFLVIFVPRVPMMGLLVLRLSLHRTAIEL